MKSLADRLRFSLCENAAPEGAIRIDTQGDTNFYETLCQYCADKDIDLKNVSDAEFDEVSEISQRTLGMKSVSRYSTS